MWILTSKSRIWKSKFSDLDVQILTLDIQILDLDVQIRGLDVHIWELDDPNLEIQLLEFQMKNS